MTLFGVLPAAPIREVGDPLDRCYTPRELARACVERVHRLLPERPGSPWGGDRVQPDVVVEPSVGGGAFAAEVRAAWPSARLVGYDLDPAAAGLALCDEAHVADWTEAAGIPTGARLVVIGNPPFSGGVAFPHVEVALGLGALVVGLILPWSYLGGVERWARLHADLRPSVVWPIVPRPWTTQMREVALYVWGAGTPPSSTSVCEPIRWRQTRAPGAVRQVEGR